MRNCIFQRMCGWDIGGWFEGDCLTFRESSNKTYLKYDIETI